jgi:Uma2 family endonuclease
MNTETGVMTAEELLRRPDDGSRYELLHGELRKMPPCGHQHGRLAAKLTASLLQHVEARSLGSVYAAETGFKLDSNPDHVRAPDVAFVRRERVLAVGDVQGFWPGAPDLAVEVISPTDSYADVDDKVLDWLNAGTRLVIVVNPRNRTVRVSRSLNEVRVLGESDTLEAQDVIPGWSLSVRDLFAL